RPGCLSRGGDLHDRTGLRRRRRLDHLTQARRGTGTVKLLRYGERGSERPGALDPDGNIRDLSSQVTDIGGSGIDPDALAQLAMTDLTSLPLVEGRPRLGPCVANVGKFICIGLNYSDHAA